MKKLVVPQDWVMVNTDHCVACGVGKYEKNKNECAVYGKLVNGGRHQYKAYEPPITNEDNSNPTNSDKRDEDHHREQCEGRY